jgi:hypothetical protein
LRNRPSALLPEGERRIAAEVFLATAGLLVVLAKVEGVGGLAVAALGMLLAAGLLIVVQAPIGSVPLGFALVIAVAALTDVGTYFTVVGLGLLATVPVLAIRYGHEDTTRRIARWILATCACGGAAVATRLLVPGSTADRLLLDATIAGAVFLGVDLVVRRWLPVPTAPPVRFNESWPVYVSLLCAAGLLTVAWDKQHWMALVALLPLVMTRFAFDRFAAAQQAYRQTIKALSIVPEVAGVTPLGHGERSAVYAVALARALGLSNDAVERVATAARLHHIGYVTLDDPQDAAVRENRVLLAKLGGDILRETEFLADVGDLVESVHAAEVTSREAAVLRIATGFDHLVLEDPARALGALQLINFSQKDPYGAAAALVLREILEEDPAVVERAIASGAPLTEAAEAANAGHG